MPNPAADPFDAILLLSFGGPERPEDVVPFLENVTRGRGIPRERLEQVGEHYFRFGGRSPINDQNRALIAALEKDLADNGVDLPVYWGNRNWTPFLTDTVRQMAADGVRRAAVLATSAYSSWSSCRQYLDNLRDAADAVPGAPVLEKIRPYFNHPGFVEPVVDRTVEAIADLPERAQAAARILFVTHSVPVSMNDDSGPQGGAYLAQHLDLAAVVAERVEERTGVARDHELVFCSRSGPPRTPWLEPDVNDRIEELAAEGVAALVLVPIGFVSDHMEVVYDLDTEAVATAHRVGVPLRRAGTAGTDPRFVAGLRDLVLERAATVRGEDPHRPAVGGFGPVWDCCDARCCLPKVGA